jgi:hypothetical protein
MVLCAQMYKYERQYIQQGVPSRPYGKKSTKEMIRNCMS